MNASQGPTAPPVDKLGLVSGQGDFPLLIARAARGTGVFVHGFGIRGFATDDLAPECSAFTWIDLGRVDTTLRAMREAGITQVILAGRVPHSAIFKTGGFDSRAMKVLARAVTRRADSLLGLVVDEFEKEGIKVLDSSLFLKSLMPSPGMITTARALTPTERADIAFAYPLAKSVAGLDIGQTVVVKEKVVVAIEALEGTDKCIRRAGELAGPGTVIVKVSKPRQDLRFDIPVVGKGTVESLKAAQASALAVSAHESFLFDQDEVVRHADDAGIAIIAVTDETARALDDEANT